MYKLYIRSNLDVGDAAYHIPNELCDYSPNIILNNQMEKLEYVQYLAALARLEHERHTTREAL